MTTIATTLRMTAARVPDHEALVFGALRLTYAELDTEVDRTAHALAGLGLARGERFALMGVNSDRWVITLLRGAAGGRGGRVDQPYVRGAGAGPQRRSATAGSTPATSPAWTPTAT